MTRSTLLTIRRMTNTGQRDLKIILLPKDLERPDGWRKIKLPCELHTLRSKIFNSRWVWRYFHLTPPLPFTTVLGFKVLYWLGKHSKIKTTKHMEFSICWFAPPPTYGKFFRDFLLSKNDFWLILRLFHFFPLKDQKYLENSDYLAQRMVVGGGVIREKNKSV